MIFSGVAPLGAPVHTAEEETFGISRRINT